ncbi:unnamed protein product [Spirodela intermedia]|uniref:Uncharacterized protein n=2 Tax=Spirodela intermedia TaxID=51605 RepID=A0A7I8JHK4_SPIIN|nr:unnamed protein product [Spirodela intermedia]CAA6669626.1 unnamed protein product [Spirodela intermedia]CAA7406592.1 unnamed protein product [Spirodela intermedia]
MIYRKWSLLTMPAVILSGLGAIVLTQNFVFGANEKFVQNIKQEGEMLRQQDRAKMALEKAA